MFFKNKITESWNSPEIELLLCCARIHISDEADARIKALVKGNIDWHLLLQVAQRNQVIPLLYATLTKRCSHALPKFTLDELNSFIRINTKRNYLLTKKLFQIIDAFNEAGIAVIPFKGPVLAQLIYGDITLRSFTDIDILVKKEDLNQAKAIVTDHGLRLTTQVPANLESKYQALDKDFQFADDKNIIKLDLHWALIHWHFASSISIERLWRNTEKVKIFNREISNFQANDLLIILCAHGSKHQWKCLQWLCDIAELIRTFEDIDWDEVISRSREHHALRAVLLGLHLAENLLDVSLPDSVLTKINNDKTMRLLATKIKGTIFQPGHDADNALSNPIFQIYLKENFSEKLKYILRSMFVPYVVDWQIVNLPKQLYFLYYILRPLKIMYKYGVKPIARKL